MERATGIEPVLPAWEFEFSILYFQYLQNRSAKINVHAMPDLRIAAGRFAGRFLAQKFDHYGVVFGDRESASYCSRNSSHGNCEISETETYGSASRE